jgi:putative SOS response-associated peptidase YedK
LVPVIAMDATRQPAVRQMRWGLVPAWEKSARPKFMPINARAEDAFGKPMFREPIQKRRCLVPASAYYEWHNSGAVTQPYCIAMKDRAPFCFAGIYEEATASRPETFALFTTSPNAVMAPIHHRMPVIVQENAVTDWLGSAPISSRTFDEIARPYPPENMEAWAVSPLVNSPKNDVPECLIPVDGGDYWLV